MTSKYFFLMNLAKLFNAMRSFKYSVSLRYSSKVGSKIQQNLHLFQ